MVGIKLREVYKYENVELTNGVKVSATEVTVQNREVVTLQGGSATVDGKTFSFSIYNYGINGEKTYNLNNVPTDVDGQEIVKEFVVFVETDIA